MRKLVLLPAISALAFLLCCGGGSSTGGNGSSGGGSGTGQVTLQSIAVSPSTAAIAQGTTQAFTAMGTYTDGSTKDLTLTAQWSCLVSTLATVSNNAPTQGLATAVAPGTAVITASVGNVSNSGQLTIKNVTATSLVLSPATANIGFGNQQQYTATATFSDQSQQDVTDVSSWSASPEFSTTHSGLVIGQNVSANNMVQASFAGGAQASATLTVDLSNLVSISLLPSPPSIANHTNLQYGAVGTFNDGSTRDVSALVTWSSSDSTDASFGSGSMLTAHAQQTPATTMISASITPATGPVISSPPAMLIVTGATLQSVIVFPVNASIASTTKLRLTAIGVFSDSSTQDMTDLLGWSVLDPTVATVAKGIVTGTPPGPGSTTVSATSSSLLGSIQGSTQINVTSATLNSIALNPANTFIPPGAALSYSAIGTFSDNSVQDISDASSWSSLFSNVATASSAVATGQGIGQSQITAKVKLVSGTAILKVASAQQISLAIAPTAVQIAAQTSTQLTATGTFVDGSVQDLTTAVQWSSSSPSVATVGAQTGTVSGLAAGKSTITATLGSVTSTTQVTVTNATLASISISPLSPSIAMGSSQQFAATGTFSDNSTQPLLDASWSSSNPAIAAVNGSGLATSTGVGTTTIMATVNGISGSTNLTVH
jgi:trimeric autotransporter adhesin